MATKTEFAYVLAPADRAWGWYYGQTAEQVGQLLSQNNALLTHINTYIDGNTWVFAIIMEPNSPTTSWYYYGQTVDQVGQLLSQNNAMLTNLCPYRDGDSMKLAVSMVPSDRPQWWYCGISADQVNQLLAQNNAMPTHMRLYRDVDNVWKYAVVMEPASAGRRCSWNPVTTADQISNLLVQYSATLTDVGAFPVFTADGLIGRTEFVVILESPSRPSESWGAGLTADQLGGMLQGNPHVRLVLLAPYAIQGYEL